MPGKYGVIRTSYLYDDRSTCAPRRYTDEIFRVLVMSSSGLASSTMKSALLFASIVPVVGHPQELRAVATWPPSITCIGVMPAATMSAISSAARTACCRRSRRRCARRRRSSSPGCAPGLPRTRARPAGWCCPSEASSNSAAGRLGFSQSMFATTPRSGMFGPRTRFGCCFTSAMNSSSRSLSRTPCANASRPARERRLRVFERVDVRDHPEAVLVRFVDDRAVELGRQLLHGAQAIVDPELDDVDFLRGVFLHRLARLGDRRHPVRRRRPARLRSRDPAARREEPAPGRAASAREPGTTRPWCPARGSARRRRRSTRDGAGRRAASRASG